MAVAVVTMWAPPAQAAEGPAVNVLRAYDHGCSPDSLTPPDLRVQVFVDSKLVLETQKAGQTRLPLYADIARTQAGLVRVRVQEAEPGGFFLLGTEWRTCDVQPGQGEEATFPWDGSFLRLDQRGDGPNAARVVLTLGPAPPPPPRVQVRGVDAHAATVAWDGAAGAEAHHVAWDTPGGWLAMRGGGEGSYSIQGLCDAMTYHVRVLRYQDGWLVPSEVQQFQTRDVAPARPVVTRVAQLTPERLEVRWTLPETHDAQRVEVYVGNPPFHPSAWSKVHSEQYRVSSSGRAAFASGGGSHAAVLLIDQGGHSSSSEPVAVGEQVRPPRGQACLPPGAGRPTPVALAPSPHPGFGFLLLRSPGLLLLASMAAVSVVALAVAAVLHARGDRRRRRGSGPEVGGRPPGRLR